MKVAADSSDRLDFVKDFIEQRQDQLQVDNTYSMQKHDSFNLKKEQHMEKKNNDDKPK